MYTNTIEQQGFRLIQRMETTLQTDVWKAQQVRLDRIVNVQVLRPEFAQNRAERDRFLAMARCFAKLKSESIASVFDIVSDGDLHYVVMEHVDGPTLEEAVSGTPLPLKQILQVASSLAFALEQLWESAHIVHRNLKGATVRLDPRGVAKITDFSLAFISKPGMDMAALDGGHIVGTPSFISPEYAQGASTLTTQSDMYAFGALLYSLATGLAPFDTLDEMEILESQVRAQIPPPHQVNSEIPVQFSWFVHRLMMKNPENRYADWRAVRYDIKCLLNDIEPRCVRPDETYLSTILAQPMLDAMAAEEENESATRKSIRLKQRGRHNAMWEEEHNRDIARHNIGTAALMSLLLLAWFAALFWFRGIWQPAHREAAPAEATANATGDDGIRETPPAPAVSDGATPSPPPLSSGAFVRPPDAAPVTPVAAKPTAAPDAVPERVIEMPKELRDTLVAAFKVGDIGVARKRLAEDTAPFTAREAVREVLDTAPTAEAMIEAGVRAKIGRNLEIEWKGKKRAMTPRGIANGIISVEVSGRTHEIMIKDLLPDERLEFAAEPKTEGEYLTYCLMILNSSYPSNVSKFAGKCPALKDLILAAR